MFKNISNRDAWATIRGYVYQVDLTILRWIHLNDNQVLELENGEDIDIINTLILDENAINEEVSRELEQIKYRKSKISLDHKAIIEVLLNFYKHRINNPHQEILFRYVSNAKDNVERPALFVNGKSGIQAWTELFAADEVQSDDERVYIINKHLQKKLSEISESEGADGALITEFVQFIENSSNLVSFIRSFEWSLGTDDNIKIVEVICQRLIDNDYAEPSNVKSVYYRLFYFVFKILCLNGLKTINKGSLLAEISVNNAEHTDTKKYEIVVQLLNSIDDRVNSLEQKVLIQSEVLKELIRSNDPQINNAIFKYTLSNFTTNPPEIIHNGTTREEKVKEIVNILNSSTWVNLVGINGTGKSQLAALVCKKFEDFYWLDLQPHNDSNGKCVLLIEAFLSHITNEEILKDRSIWIKRVLNNFPRTTLIVLNDIPKIETGSPLYNLLIQFKGKSIKLITTSNYNMPVSLINEIDKDGLIEYDQLDFSDEEIIEFIVNSGGDKEILPYLSLIVAISRRSPRITSSIIYSLKSINWGKDDSNLLDSLLNKELTAEVLEDTQSSISKLITDETSRNLLYRLSLIDWEFTLNDVIKIASIEDSIPNPNEKLHNILNKWIQKVNNNLFLSSPLIFNLGEKNLSQNVVFNVHLTMAHSILSQKKLDPLDASRCILSFIRANDYNNAGFILFNFYQSVKSESEARFVDEWGYLQYWLESDPKDINITLRANIRREQIRISRKIGKNPSFYLKWLDSYASDNSISISERTFINFIAITTIDINDLLHYWKYLDYIIENWVYIEKPFDEVINEDTFSHLLTFPLQTIVEHSDITRWLYFCDKFNQQLGIYIFDDDFIQLGVMALCSRIVNNEGRKPVDDKSWQDVLNRFSELEGFFRRYKLEEFVAIVLNEVIAIEYRILDNQSHALKLATSNINGFYSSTAKYFLCHTLGKIYYQETNINASKQWIFQAIQYNCVEQINFIDTLIYGAAIESITNTQEALKLCTQAYDLCQKAINSSNFEGSFLELDLQMQGELGIAYWLNGDYLLSFQCFEKLVTDLFSINPDSRESFWYRILLWTGHSLGYIAPSIASDETPKFLSTGEEYIKPHQGFFVFNTKDVTDLYDPVKEPIIMANLAAFADGINEIEIAYSWSLQAFDLARKNDNQWIFTTVSIVCSKYSLINFKVEEAFETYLLQASALMHLTGTPIEKSEALKTIKLDALLGAKPSNNWNAAEDITVTYAIIPMLLMVLNAKTKSDTNYNERLHKLLKLITDYIPNSSDKTLWETVLELCTRINKKTINEQDLSIRSNHFNDRNSRNLQMICLVGVIVITKSEEAKILQIINVFPYLTKVFGSSKSIIKNIIAPFVQTVVINVIKTSYIGSKAELNSLLEQIESTSFQESFAIQNMLKPAVSLLGLDIEGDRKVWLYEGKEI